MKINNLFVREQNINFWGCLSTFGYIGLGGAIGKVPIFLYCAVCFAEILFGTRAFCLQRKNKLLQSSQHSYFPRVFQLIAPSHAEVGGLKVIFFMRQGVLVRTTNLLL